MKLNDVLSLLNNYEITVHQDTEHPNGSRAIILAGRLPSFPYGYNRMAYYTLVLSPGEDDIPIEIREAIRRHMHHLTTDIFGDDAVDPDMADPEEENGNSHFHEIIEKE